MRTKVRGQLPSPWSQGPHRCPGRLGDLSGLVFTETNSLLPSISICGPLALKPRSRRSDALSYPQLLGDSRRVYRKLAAGHSSNYRHGANSDRR